MAPIFVWSTLALWNTSGGWGEHHHFIRTKIVVRAPYGRCVAPDPDLTALQNCNSPMRRDLVGDDSVRNDRFVGSVRMCRQKQHWLGTLDPYETGHVR